MKIKSLLIVILAITSFIRITPLCAQTHTEPGKEAAAVGNSQDLLFDTIAEDFLNRYLEFYPSQATEIGNHQFDQQLESFTQERIDKRVAALKEFQVSLNTILHEDLSQSRRLDFAVIANAIESEQFDLDSLKRWEHDPLLYNQVIGRAVLSLMTREFAPPETRMKSLLERMRQIPSLLDQARVNLKNPPRIHTETAIAQQKGCVALFENLVLEEARKLSEPLKSEVTKEARDLLEVLKLYGRFLEEDLLPRSSGNFRVGEQTFTRMLQITLQSTLTKEEVLRRAEEELKNVREEMYQVSLPLHRKYFPHHRHFEKGDLLVSKVVREVLDKISQEHPARDGFLDAIRQSVSELRDYILEKKIVTLPSPDLLKVDLLPEVYRGVAGANLFAPGPFEPNGSYFYYVTPIPQEWPEKQAESFLREYNNYMIRILSIHEALPGHYVQLASANRNSSPIRSVFGNDPFIEGWAVLTERLMVDGGFGNHDPRLKLMQLKFYLRAVINALLDIKVHTQDLSREEAMKLMLEGGFQEEAEAEGKWKRACLTSCQLSTYFVGLQEWLDIYNEYRKIKGDDFLEREFMETAMQYGSPPLHLLKPILVGESQVQAR